MNIREEIALRAKNIQAVIESYLIPVCEAGYEKTMIEAMNYSVMAGGKRLRPMLMEESFHLFGGEGTAVEPFMAAMECIHTYSLVHDDLPAMDNDEYRRGKKTTHAVYGEAMGILAGDALLNYAYELMAGAMVFPGNDTSEESRRKMRAFYEIARAAGVSGMVAGQVVDVESEELSADTMTRDKIDYIYEKKTAALIEASLRAGAILAGAKEEEIDAIGRAGRLLGIAFQIQDDILDVTGTLEELGKPIGSDEKNHKVTYVTLHGMEKAKEDVAHFSYEAVQILDSLSPKNTFLKDLFVYLVHRTT